MCLGSATSRSASSVSSPKLPRASRRAELIASARSSARWTSRMPLPPPPALGLSSTGYPIRSAARASASSSRPGPSQSWPDPSEPGTTGTPALATVCLARILSPIASIAEAGGPTNAIPAAAQAAANSVFSDRNP